MTAVLLISIVAACSNSEESKESTDTSTSSTESGESTDTSTNTPEKKYKIVFINPLSNYIGYVNQEKSTKEAANDYGVELTVLGVPTADGIVEKNVEALENAIALNPDAIILVAFNKTLFPGIKKAKDQGIKIITTGADAEEALRDAFIGSDNKGWGITAANIIKDKFAGKANVGMMHSFLDASNQVEARTAFEEKIKEMPDVKILAVDASGADMTKATEKFDTMIRANKDLDMIWMLEGTSGTAAPKIAKDQNRKINVIDVDDKQETLDMIKSGDIYATLAQNFNRMGYESVRLAVEILDGVEGTPTVVDSGIIVVTKDNVDNYSVDMEKAIKKKGTPW